MTFADVSTRDKDAVRALLKCFQNVGRNEHARAHQPDQPDARRILHSAYTREIGSCIGTPIARERYDFGVKLSGHVVSMKRSFMS
jgi:hypothetical protein